MMAPSRGDESGTERAQLRVGSGPAAPLEEAGTAPPRWRPSRRLAAAGAAVACAGFVAGVLVRAVGWRSLARQALGARSAGLVSEAAAELVGSSVGCRNLASIRTGELVILDSAQKCADRCKERSDCVQFNWQKGNTPGRCGRDECDMAEYGYTFGTCLMYKQPCETVHSDKWDLYSAEPDPPGEGPRYCPAVSDLQSGEGASALEDQGWTIEGSGRVGTRASFDLNGGSVQFMVQLEGVPSGSVGGQLVSALVGLIMPQGSGEFSWSEDYCDGSAGGKFCPDVHLLQTNGRSAYSVSLRTSDDAEGECYAEVDGKSCVAERFFQSDRPCGAAPDAVIDATKEFYVGVSFPSSGHETELIVTLRQGDAEQTIRLADLAEGAAGPPSLVSQKVLFFSLRAHGAVLTSSLQGVAWAPKGGACPDGAASLQGARLRVRRLVVQGQLVRGTCTLCQDAR
ncbi:unnamed protein product [Prorocentrum cordatum]|uniref:Apple domain-containing protein n=1 Tax=Prorocentrum cordatum TaxID=2364126 RepID=A0ABN9VN81_9DINO|nr:unnamed protein product [Polarella glacialis]